MFIRAFILEDDAQAMASMRSALQAHPDVEVVGSSGDIDEARPLLQVLQPDLLFSDVMLPPHTSFDLLHTLDRIPFEIIFVTSFEEFAIKAFRLAAVDYLLKPVSAGDLADALQKYRERRQGQQTATHLQQMLANLQRPAQARIALPTLTGFLFVSIKNIVRCESDNTYTTFHTLDKQKIIVSRTLKECEQLLNDHGFFRVHNSHLINLEYIVEYLKGEGGVVRMADGSHVDVSRRRKDEFLKVLR